MSSPWLRPYAARLRSVRTSVRHMCRLLRQGSPPTVSRRRLRRAAACNRATVCRSQQQHIQPSPLPCHPARQGSDGVLKYMNMLIFNGSVKLTHYTSMSAPPILKSVTPAANMVALTITDCRWRGVDASDGDGSVGRGGCVRCRHRGSRVWARWPACSRRSGHLGIACALSDAPSSPCAPCRWRWRSRQRPRSPWSGSTLRPSCGQASAQHSSAAARPAAGIMNMYYIIPWSPS